MNLKIKANGVVIEFQIQYIRGRILGDEADCADVMEISLDIAMG